MSLDGQHIHSIAKKLLKPRKGKVGIAGGVVAFDLRGISATALANASSGNFLAVQIGDESVVIVNHQTEFRDGIGALQFEFAANINDGVTALHVVENRAGLLV